MRRLGLLVVGLWVGLGWSSGAGASTTLTVPGTTSIWLADQSVGATLFGDVVPVNSPTVLSLNSIGLPASVSFGVTGASARRPTCCVGLVGGDGESATVSLGSQFDLGGAVAPYSSLVGVFIDSTSSHPTPAFSNFASSGSRSFASLSPSIQQVFFIGDGLTGTGNGVPQQFIVPNDADLLYLATFDTSSWDNSGSLQVTVTPEPSTALLLGLGLASLAVRREK